MQSRSIQPKRTSAIIATLLPLLCFSATQLVAQESVLLDNSTAIPSLDPPSAVPSGLEANLQALMQTTRQLRDRLNSPQQDSVALEPPEVVRTPMIPALSATPDDGRTASENVDDLRKRIDLLRRLRNRRPTPTNQPGSSQPESPLRPTQSRQLMIPAVPMDSGTDRSATQRTPEPTLPAIESNLANEMRPSVPETAQPEVMTATQIFDTPVDHMALGQSLYQTKNYQAALTALKAVKTETLSPADLTWLELLIALCQRRLGNVEFAEAQFREISNAKVADRAVPIARWWLKQSELVQSTQPTMDAISSELDSLIERSQKYVP